MQLRMNIPPRATRTVFCVGSGPSLTREDCAAIEKTGCSIIAVNNSWQMFDDIYALYAGDLSWWKQYGSTIPGGKFRKVTANLAAAKSFSLEYRRYCGPAEGVNSGAQAISLAAESGAEVVVLVGYDCSSQTAFIGMARTLKPYGIQRRCLFQNGNSSSWIPAKNTQIYIF